MDPSAYKPQPVDTSEIELGEELRSKIEALARNNHEVWAQARAAEGWKYGPERNDARKVHPGLVPYEQLSEAEKEIDRGTVIQTLKAAKALGFDIHRYWAGTQTQAVYAETGGVPEDDIVGWPPWPHGASGDAIAALDLAGESIINIYERADRSARINLWLHRIIATTVAVLGTGTVLAAIFQLYSRKEDPIAAWVEVILAGLALLAVGVGIAGVFMRRWLLRRHRAERCRFLKFDFLLEVGLAGRERNELLRIARQFTTQANAVARVEDEDMERWLGKEPVLQNPPAASEDKTVVDDMRALAEHYRRTRLEVQSRYFSKQASRDARWNWQSQKHAPMLFAASICFALTHFVIHHCYPEKMAAGLYFTFLAACFPAIGAGVRALRGISEFSRNSLRFTAKQNALDELIKELERELAGNPTARDIVLLLWKGEQVLEGEHREWLRLMMETEWIG